MVRSAMFVFAVVSGLAGPAVADTLQVFDVSATYQDFEVPPCATFTCPGGSLTGTLTIDRTLGTIASASLSSELDGVSDSFSGAPVTQGFVPNSGFLGSTAEGAYGATFQNGDATLVFNMDLFADETYYPNLSVYDGGPICSVTLFCGEILQNFSQLEDSIPPFYGGAVYSGTLTPEAVVATPEPSSLVLLGTGVLGAASVVRRRLRRG